MATYTNSPLVNYTKISPNKTTTRVHKTHNPNGVIDKITIHHVAGKASVETIGNIFANPDRDASSTYGIGTDARVGMYCEEKHRPWTSSSAANDYRAVTIEVSNDQVGGNWHVSDKVLDKLVELCVDICKRNGIKKLNYTGNKNGNLTLHKWFAATSCPGPYLESKMPWIAEQVNKKLVASQTTATPSKPASTTTTSTTNTYKAGQAITLKNAPLYATSMTSKAASNKSGTYYIWSKDVVNKRIRITNSAKNVGKSGQVTGWIDVSSISGSTPATNTTATTSKPTTTTKPAAPKTYKKGDAVKLSNTPLYTSSSSTKARSKKSGTYYIYDGEKVNGKYRITNKAKNCGKKPVAMYVTGWVAL